MLRSKLCILSAFSVPMLLSACVADTSAVAVNTPPPRTMTFQCDGKVGMTVVRAGKVAHVTDSRGADIELAASPPAQQSRYSHPGYALVLEGRQALWMVSGKRPVNCSR